MAYFIVTPVTTQCYKLYRRPDAEDFFGWEADRVIAVTGGDYIMELMTRARTRLCGVLVERPFHPCLRFKFHKSLF